MDLVGEIVKVTDQTQLYHNTTSNSSDNTVPFDTCFTNILELLQIKMSELVKKIKKYKIPTLKSLKVLLKIKVFLN